jgi:anti-sigma B factor antagonist
VVLTPKKNLLGGEETQALLAVIDEVAAKTIPKIVVDLGMVSYLNSVGLGSLVKANTTCLNRSGWLRLARVGSKINNLFLVTKLVFVFDTYETVDEAVAAPQKQPRQEP